MSRGGSALSPHPVLTCRLHCVRDMSNKAHTLEAAVQQQQPSRPVHPTGSASCARIATLRVLWCVHTVCVHFVRHTRRGIFLITKAISHMRHQFRFDKSMYNVVNYQSALVRLVTSSMMAHVLLPQDSTREDLDLYMVQPNSWKRFDSYCCVHSTSVKYVITRHNVSRADHADAC